MKPLAILIFIVILILLAVVLENTTGLLTFVAQTSNATENATEGKTTTTVATTTTTVKSSGYSASETTTTTRAASAAGGGGGSGSDGNGGGGSSSSDSSGNGASPVVEVANASYLMILVNPEYKLLTSNSTQVSVDINSSYGVYAFQFSLYFNASVLNATNATEGKFLDDNATYSIIRINNSAGRIDIAATRIGQGSVSGYGATATIGFYAKGAGYSALSLEDVLVVDAGINQLPLAIKNGGIEVQ